jgi:cytochrome c55X
MNNDVLNRSACVNKKEIVDRNPVNAIPSVRKYSALFYSVFFLCLGNVLPSQISAAYAHAPASRSDVALVDAASASIEAPSPKRRAELITLVRQDCGSCHGMTLKGGLGPSLLPDALKDKPAESLQATILQGRPGSAMPGWQRFVNEAEVTWIVEQLQKGFPDEK